MSLKSHKVLSPKQLPVRLPIMSTAVAWLLLDRLHSPSWVCWEVGALFALLWVAAIVLKITQRVTQIAELDGPPL